MHARETYLLAGPTASGKSSAAVILARRLGAAILNADSMLVYKGMDIGTAKPALAERTEFSMGCVDLVSVAEDFSCGAWLRAAQAWVQTLEPKRPIVVVGGTGLYFTTLLRGIEAPWTNPPPAYPVLTMPREQLRMRIRARIDLMFAQGLEAEVARLREAFPVWSRTSAAAIGYKEFFVPSRVPGRTVREDIYYRTSQFAKRQDTWFRHQATPLWVEASDNVMETAGRVWQCWQTHGPWYPSALT